MVTRRLCLAGLFSVLTFCASVPGGERILYRGDSEYNQIIVTEDDGVTQARLWLVEGSKSVMVGVLGLLGLTAPESM